MDVLLNIWEYQIHVVPIIVLVLIYELGFFIRKYKRRVYIPVYFSVFPFSETNLNVAQFLGEDYWYDTDKVDTDTKKKEKLLQIRYISMISLAISAIIIPIATGLIAHFIVDRKIFTDFVIVLFTYKTMEFGVALKHFGDRGYQNARIYELGTVYIIYLITSWYLLYSTYQFFAGNPTGVANAPIIENVFLILGKLCLSILSLYISTGIINHMLKRIVSDRG